MTGGFVSACVDLAADADAVVMGGVLLDGAVVPGIENCLGAVRLAPHSPPTDTLAHSTSEVMFVSQGTGLLVTDDGEMPLRPGVAIYIPARAWHSLHNTGDAPLISVFSFPSPYRPETVTRVSGSA